MTRDVDRDLERELVSAAAKGARGGGSWQKTVCPLCPSKVGKAPTDATLSVSRDHGGWHCFRCGSSGSLSTDGSEYVPPAPPPPRPWDWKKLPPSFRPLGHECFRSGEGSVIAGYARKRIRPEACLAADVGGALDGFLAGRCVVPIRARDGSPNGWVARAAWPKPEPRDKYRNPPGMEFGGCVFNEAALDRDAGEPLLVMEGVFDALAHWPHAVAVLGGVTARQIDSLAGCARPVVFVPDGDAWRKGEADMYRLRLRGRRCGSVRLPPGADPDQLDRCDLWEVARASLSSPCAVPL